MIPMPISQSSSRENGLSPQGDRERLCRLIFRCASQLLIPNVTFFKPIKLNTLQPSANLFNLVCSLCMCQTTAAVAVTYLHRFLSYYDWEAIQSNSITCLLASLLFLACKATENWRPIRDIYNVITLNRHSSISLDDLDKVFSLPSLLFILQMDCILCFGIVIAGILHAKGDYHRYRATSIAHTELCSGT
jgi:hypothetical protein